MPLTGTTLITAVFGDPVAHSLSPAMHNAAYQALAMDRAYLAFHVKTDNLRAAIRAIPAMGLLGVNLTLPHKERVLRMLDGLSGEARSLGAVNCVVSRRDGLYGDNTDARGLETDLRERGVVVARRGVVIVGAGGGAAAAVLAAVRMGASQVLICNRTRSRAMRLARRFAGRAGRIIRVMGLDALTDRSALSAAALVINATSIELHKPRELNKADGQGAMRFPELDYEATPRDCFFYDLFYGAKPTQFLERAHSAGRSNSDGAGMLLNQAVLAFRLFNGVAPPVDVMRRALMEHLGRAI
jgi:shikimate dehydrogenase